MTTASILLTVSANWGNSDICDKDVKVGRSSRNLAAIAARELRETPGTREQAVRLMRDWISQNADIKNVRQDESFLVRFLRHKKYSIPMAQQTLLKYLNLRKHYPEIFDNLDCEEDRTEQIINDGYIMVSPNRDQHGRRVIVYKISKFNAQKFSCWDMARVHVIVYETLMEDPIDQICGVTHVGDGVGVTGAHITAWNPADFGRLFKWGEQSIPMRHKQFHMVNIPSPLKYIIDFAASKVSTKLAQRLHIYTNLNQLHKNVDVDCLPASYGGNHTDEEMTKYTMQLLKDQKKKLLQLSDMEILNSRGIISTRKSFASKNNDVSIEGSFRKLEID